MSPNHIKHICIIGGGISGLASAHFLLQKNYRVTIYEKESGTGGLATSTQINGINIEKYYHHFFSSDTELIRVASEIGIKDKIRFYTSSIGMYVNKKLYSFTSPFDLLKYSEISLVDRIKMGMISMYLIKKRSWENLEKYTVKDFFNVLHSPKLYDKIWLPLLQLKFGKHAHKIPATFLWGRIHPRGRSRRGMQETLGYFDGGYHTFFDSFTQNLLSHGIELKHETVLHIKQSDHEISITTETGEHVYDAVIFTGSNQLLVKLYSHFEIKTLNKLSKVKYQAINCMILELRQSISPYYWLNVLDKDISFIGCIEHTQLIPSEIYGRHVMYLFNYLPPTDKLFTMSPKAVYNLYIKDLKKIFPEFKDSLVIRWELSRHPFATPIYSGKYSKNIPPFQIDRRLFLANTTQVYPEDRNVNNGIRLAENVVKTVSAFLQNKL